MQAKKNVYAYKKLFKEVDVILKNIKDWKFIYKFKGKDYMEEGKILVLGYSEKAHKYLKFKTEVNLKKDIIEIDKITDKAYIKTLEKNLKSKGYNRISG